MGKSTRGLGKRAFGLDGRAAFPVWSPERAILGTRGRVTATLETTTSDMTTTGASLRISTSTVLTACAMIGAVAVSGCGMSSLTSGLGTSVFGGASPAAKSDVKTVSEDQLLSDAKAGDGTAPAAITSDAGGCPRFVVGQRDNNLTIYETGRVGDGLAIIHRGEITKTGRECQIEPGKVTIRYGFAGRVLLGPKGKSGTIKLPVVITVTDAKREKVATDTIKVDVEIAVDKPIGYFSAVKAITIPIPEGSRPGEFEILVGFDRAVPGAG